MNIPIQNIYFLLSYSWNRLDFSEEEKVKSDDYKTLLDLLVRSLINELGPIIKEGLDRTYREHEEVISGIKGSIDFSTSLKLRLFNRGKAHCRFDIYTEDILQNRIIKSTLWRLLRMQELNLILKKDVERYYHRLQGIELLDIQSIDFSLVRLHRNNIRYRGILNICQLIFHNITLNEQTGEFLFHDFSRDEKKMALLFEDFVRSFYAKEQEKYKVRREDIRWNFHSTIEAQRLLPKMQTDISLESKNHKLIIETKFYKETLSTNFSSEKIKSNNLYQLYSYLRNIEKDKRHPKNHSADGMLLYPSVGHPLLEQFTFDQHQISIATVDLSVSWRSIHCQLLSLIEGGGGKSQITHKD